MPNNRPRHVRSHSRAGQNRRSQSAVNATVDILPPTGLDSSHRWRCHHETSTELPGEGIALDLT
jgi:hypothetical protein